MRVNYLFVIIIHFSAEYLPTLRGIKFDDAKVIMLIKVDEMIVRQTIPKIYFTRMILVHEVINGEG